MASAEMRESNGLPERDFARPFRLTAGDLISDLLWPKLFRVPRLAIQPSRVMLAVLLILLVGLIDQALAGITPAEDEPAQSAWGGPSSRRSFKGQCRVPLPSL